MAGAKSSPAPTPSPRNAFSYPGLGELPQGISRVAYERAFGEADVSHKNRFGGKSLLDPESGIFHSEATRSSVLQGILNKARTYTSQEAPLPQVTPVAQSSAMAQAQQAVAPAATPTPVMQAAQSIGSQMTQPQAQLSKAPSFQALARGQQQAGNPMGGMVDTGLTSLLSNMMGSQLNNPAFAQGAVGGMPQEQALQLLSSYAWDPYYWLNQY